MVFLCEDDINRFTTSHQRKIMQRFYRPLFLNRVRYLRGKKSTLNERRISIKVKVATSLSLPLFPSDRHLESIQFTKPSHEQIHTTFLSSIAKLKNFIIKKTHRLTIYVEWYHLSQLILSLVLVNHDCDLMVDVRQTKQKCGTKCCESYGIVDSQGACFNAK